MAFDLASISRGRIVKAPRILLLGVEKVGKTTWASDAPSPIFLPIKGETGMDELDAPRTPVCNSYEDVIGWLQTLCTTDHDYKTTVIDSSSALEPMVWARTCKEHGVASIEQVLKGFGKGYIEAMKYWQEIRAALDYLRDERGMGTIIIAHVKVKSFNDPLADPYDKYMVDLQERAAAMLTKWADHILFANFKNYSRIIDPAAPRKITHATGGQERAIFTQSRAGHPGGGRVALPYELPFNYAAFADAVNKARAATAN